MAYLPSGSFFLNFEIFKLMKHLGFSNTHIVTGNVQMNACINKGNNQKSAKINISSYI